MNNFFNASSNGSRKPRFGIYWIWQSSGIKITPDASDITELKFRHDVGRYVLEKVELLMNETVK